MFTERFSMGSTIVQVQGQTCHREHHTFKSLMTPKLFHSSTRLSLMLIYGYTLSQIKITFLITYEHINYFE